MQNTPVEYFQNPYHISPLIQEDGNADSMQETLVGRNSIHARGYPSPYLASKPHPKQTSIIAQVKDSHSTHQTLVRPEKHAAAAASSQSPKPTLNLQLSSLDPNQFLDDQFSPSEFPLSTTSSQGQSPITKNAVKRDRSKNHTPRPSNSFILYRREKHVEIMSQYKGVKTLNNNVISKIVANMWRSESPEVKAHFAALADAEKKAHLLKYPDYKYRPRKSPTKKQPTSPSVKKPASPTKDAALTSIASPTHQNHAVLVNQHFASPGYQVMPQWTTFPAHMTPTMTHYSPVHVMDSHRIPMMDQTEIERGFDMMNDDRFAMPYAEGEFLPQESLLSPSDYSHAWPMGGSVHWDLGLGHKLEGAE
ncbi:hypothetical protein HDU91_005826 [Kappamyces sp. JEL0680]|nr:hypothetical protein HDU91_005826 [Kappamyces sp. JEL0680]